MTHLELLKSQQEMLRLIKSISFNRNDYYRYLREMRRKILNWVEYQVEKDVQVPLYKLPVEVLDAIIQDSCSDYSFREDELQPLSDAFAINLDRLFIKHGLQPIFNDRKLHDAE